MSGDSTSTTVRILDKEYQFACPSDDQDALVESARFLDRKMKEIRDSGRTIGLDRIAVMAALNITHDLLNQKCESSDQAELSSQLKFIREKVETALK